MSKRENENVSTVHGKRLKLNRSTMNVGMNEARYYVPGPVFTGVLISYKENASKGFRSGTVCMRLNNAVVLHGGRRTWASDPNVTEVRNDPFGKPHLEIVPHIKEKGRDNPRGASPSGYPTVWTPHYFHPGQVVYIRGPCAADSKDKLPPLTENDVGKIVECLGVFIVVTPYEKDGEIVKMPALSCGDIRRVTFEDGSPASMQALNFVEANLVAFSKPLPMAIENHPLFNHEMVPHAQFDLGLLSKEWVDAHANDEYNPIMNVSLLTLPETASATLREFYRHLPSAYVAEVEMDHTQRHEKDLQLVFSEKIKDVEHNFIGMRSVIWVDGVYVSVEMQNSIFNEGPLNALGLTRDIKTFGGLWTSLGPYLMFHAPVMWNVRLDLKKTANMRENETNYVTWGTRVVSVNADVRSLLQTAGIPITKELAEKFYNKITADPKRVVDADLGDLLEVSQGVVPLYCGTPRTKGIFSGEDKDAYTFWMLRPLKERELTNVLRADADSKTVADYVRHIRAKCNDDPAALSSLVMVEKKKLKDELGDAALADFVSFCLPPMDTCMDRVPIFAVRGSIDTYPVSERHMNLVRTTISQPYESDDARIAAAVEKLTPDGLSISAILPKACVDEWHATRILERMVADGVLFKRWDTVTTETGPVSKNLRYCRFSEAALAVTKVVDPEGSTLQQLTEATGADKWQMQCVLELLQMRNEVFVKDEKYYRL